MHRWLRTLALGTAAVLAGCGGEAPEPAQGSAAAGDTLHLLARLPERTVEQPALIQPQGDIPGTGTWGGSDGGGWSRTLHELGGQSFLVTSQPVARLALPATHAAERELVLALWCHRPAAGEGEEHLPGPVTVRLNGEDLSKGATFTVTRAPGLLTIEAPEPLWVRGDNALEIEVPVQSVDGRRAWDNLALASVAYGPPETVALDPARETARLAHRTGLVYAVELASDATLVIEGSAGGAGELRVRTGLLDPRTGKEGADAGEPARLAADARGRLAGTVALPRRSGAVRTVELEWSARDGDDLVLTRLDVEESREAARPPIVFVSIDTFAAQHLSIHGYSRETTPVLAALEEDAVVFERCLANAPWTLPSYLSVMTGLYPRAHDVAAEVQKGAEPDIFGSLAIAPSRWTLAEALRARGYVTGGFVDTYWLSPLYGVRQGFDTYDGQAALAPLDDVTKGIELIVTDLVPRWLGEADPERPPFLFVHALDAHGPYWPEVPFQDRFHAQLGPERTLAPAGSVNQTYRAIPKWMALTLFPREDEPMPEEMPVEEIVARYDETLLKVDHWLGELFDLLRERGLYDDAVIVVTGDHGETFGPGVWGHGVMREDVLHVPLVLKLPRGAHGGTRVAEPVSLVDLYPTLLALSGTPPEPSRLHGTSLLARIERAAADEDAGELPLYSEGGHVEQYAITVGRWRLVEEHPGSESGEYSLLTHPRVPESWLRAHFPDVLEHPLTEELLASLRARDGYAARIAELRGLVAGPYLSLHDLESDPDERRDLAAERPDVVAKLLPLLEAERARSRAARADASGLVVPELGAEAQAQLGALGYGTSGAGDR